MEKVSSQSWKFGNILMGYNHTKYQDLLGINKSSSNQELVRLHFGIRGDYSFKYGQLGRNFDLVGGHHNIMYSKGLDLEVCNKSLEIETLGVNFPKEIFLDFTQDGDELLKKFSEKVLNGESVLISEKWGSINSPIQNVIDEILINPYAGSLQNIFLLAKTLELLVLCVDNYKASQAKKFNYLKTSQDKEAIIAARDYINARLSSPPNLTEIAKAVGVNEFKLKYGFKEMFHTTIFSYLTEKRLNLAKQYLLDSDKTLSEIAADLGYSSTQHFHNQFKKKFDKTPKSFRSKM